MAIKIWRKTLFDKKSMHFWYVINCLEISVLKVNALIDICIYFLIIRDELVEGWVNIKNEWY